MINIQIISVALTIWLKEHRTIFAHENQLACHGYKKCLLSQYLESLKNNRWCHHPVVSLEYKSITESPCYKLGPMIFLFCFCFLNVNVFQITSPIKHLINSNAQIDLPPIINRDILWKICRSFTNSNQHLKRLLIYKRHIMTMLILFYLYKSFCDKNASIVTCFVSK